MRQLVLSFEDLEHYGQTIDDGNSFDGWLDCSTGSIGIAAGIVNFWKEFPKALGADENGTVRVSLFPEEYLGLYNFRVGVVPIKWSHTRDHKGRRPKAPLCPAL